MSTPSPRSAPRIGPSGRWLARESPSNRTSADVSAATAGRNRITVPAFPTSPWTVEPCAGCPGVTRQHSAPLAADPPRPERGCPGVTGPLAADPLRPEADCPGVPGPLAADPPRPEAACLGVSPLPVLNSGL